VLVECVPNFSEGRRVEVLDAIAAAAAQPGVRVLGLSHDPDHNRAVLTLAGEGEAVAAGVLRAARVAVERIDLTVHEGVHPRMGAVDVVPFVPLGDTPMAEAVRLAVEVGRRLADELGVPVFLYGRAATRADRRDLAAVRRGQFEGLAARMAAPAGHPDFGPPVPHPTAGAVAVGARAALIAFNVWLRTDDVTVARSVARAVRGSSGGLVGVKALGLDTRRRGMVQVSMNLVDWRRTPIATALELVRRMAEAHGVAVAGTEIVGYVPLGALLDAARHYLQAHTLDESSVLELALLREELAARTPGDDPLPREQGDEGEADV
jgi:glutamate formiminotransferase